MKLHNIPAIPMMSKQVITDLDSSKVSSPGHTSVVFLMNFDSKRSYVLLIFSYISFLFVISEIFEKQLNNTVDQIEQYHLLSDFQYGFRFSRPTKDLLVFPVDKTATVFNISGATRVVVIATRKVFDRV